MQYVHLSEQSEIRYGPLQSKPKHDLFVETLSYLDPLIKHGCGLTVTEIKNVVSSLAENCDLLRSIQVWASNKCVIFF